MPCRASREVPVAATSALQLLVRGLLPRVDPLQVDHQLHGHPFAGLADRVTGADPSQDGLGLGGREVLLRATGQHFQQDPVQLADLAGVFLADRAAPVHQQLQHLELRVGHDRAQPRHPGADQRDRVRVGGVGLAALPGGEHPGPRGQLRRHVHDVLAVGEEPVGDVPPDAFAALDRPHPLRPRGTCRASRRSPRRVVSNRPPPTTVSSAVITSIVTLRLCGSIPTTTRGTCFLHVSQWPERVWAIEGCEGIGRHIAHRLLGGGEVVVDVPAKPSARARVFATGQGRKTDATDAHSVALVHADGGAAPGLRAPHACAEHLSNLPLYKSPPGCVEV